jgi:hypothetical protein
LLAALCCGTAHKLTALCCGTAHKLAALCCGTANKLAALCCGTAHKLAALCCGTAHKLAALRCGTAHKLAAYFTSATWNLHVSLNADFIKGSDKNGAIPLSFVSSEITSVHESNEEETMPCDLQATFSGKRNLVMFLRQHFEHYR